VGGGGTALERRTHLIAWDVVIKEKANGGLSIRSMKQLNSAFLMKLGWRLHNEPSTLWARILTEKYSRGGDLDNRIRRGYPWSNAWKGIMETRELTNQGMGAVIGDGRQTAF